ncbi:MAG: ribonuclease III family protein [Candidatus Methylomirabilia bacterium]
MLAAEGLGALERRLGHSFRDRALLLRALTHASYAHEHSPEPDNASLALLGDAVLALVVTERLWDTTGDEPVGVLTTRRAEVVAGAMLARWAERIELGPLLRLGRGEQLTGGRQKDSLLATALEAVLGAVYLEGGLDVARAVVGRLWVW